MKKSASTSETADAACGRCAPLKYSSWCAQVSAQVNVCVSVDQHGVNTRLDVYFLTAARTTKASNVVWHQIV